MQGDMTPDNPSEAHVEFGSPEWAVGFRERHGLPLIAGAEGDGGAPAGAEGGDDGGGDGGSDLYDLNSVPEQYRGDVERIAKEIDGNVTRRFQEAADYRSQWEPYEELGLDQYEPEALQGLLAFAELAEDDDALQEWWESVGDSKGWFDAGEGDGGGLEGDDGFEPDEQQRMEAVANMLEKMLDDRLGPVEESLSEAQEEALVSEASDLLDERLAALEEEHGEFDQEAVLELALAYAPDPNALDMGYERYKEIVNGAATSAINGKANQPAPSGGEGPSNTNRSMPVDFDEAGKMALARLTSGS